MVIVHGAGSQKENHGDFGRACAAAGWAALAYDQRGHGDSDDEMSPEALADVGRMARFLAAREEVDAGRVCVRGSSMGGFVAIHGAATSDAIAGRDRDLPGGRAAPAARAARRNASRCGPAPRRARSLEAWLGEHDLRDAVALAGRKPLLLIHARGDERIPSEWSEELFEHAAEPRKLIVLPGGHHRSAQHDAELQGLALRWLERSLWRS